MSYDLILMSGTSLSEENVQLLRRRMEQGEDLSCCEVVETPDTGYDPGVSRQQDILTVCLPNIEEVAGRSFTELKAIARDYGLRLYDPQAGVDVDLQGSDFLPEMY